MVKEAEENKEADEKRKGDIEVKNKAQTYVDEINSVLNDPAQSGKLTPEQKAQLTQLRDDAQGAIQSNNIDKLREIVGKLEDAANQAHSGQFQQQAGAQGAASSDAGNASNESSTEGHEGPDDVVDADFTDKKKK
jgi:molecular chaperone DnaK